MRTMQIRIPHYVETNLWPIGWRQEQGMYVCKLGWFKLHDVFRYYILYENSTIINENQLLYATFYSENVLANIQTQRTQGSTGPP